MKICGIYKITSPSNKIYIGQSVDIMKRFSNYRCKSCKLQKHLYASFIKYGVEKHKFEILCQCEKEQLNNLEVYYIELYQSFNSKNGLNLRIGGDSKIKISDETRQRIKEGVRGKYNNRKHSPETIEKLKVAQRNKPPEFYKKLWEIRKKNGTNKGYKHKKKRKPHIVTDETRRKLSESHKGKKMSESAYLKLKNRIITEKTREKLRTIQKGKKYTYESKQKMSDSANRRWDNEEERADQSKKAKEQLKKRKRDKEGRLI